MRILLHPVTISSHTVTINRENVLFASTAQTQASTATLIASLQQQNTPTSGDLTEIEGLLNKGPEPMGLDNTIHLEGSKGPTAEITDLGPILESANEQSAEITELNPISPPGFEGPPKFLKISKDQPARRSPRLKEKHNGLYIPALDKARKVMGYAEKNPPPPTPKKKAKQSSTVLPTYLLSKDPITGEQAQIVTLLAGIEVEKDLEEAILQVVHGAMPEAAPVQGAEQGTTANGARGQAREEELTKGHGPTRGEGGPMEAGGVNSHGSAEQVGMQAIEK